MKILDKILDDTKEPPKHFGWTVLGLILLVLFFMFSGTSRAHDMNDWCRASGEVWGSPPACTSTHISSVGIVCVPTEPLPPVPCGQTCHDTLYSHDEPHPYS